MLIINHIINHQFGFNNNKQSARKEFKYLLQIQVFDTVLLDFLFAPYFAH